jgi:hypothetical protein
VISLRNWLKESMQEIQRQAEGIFVDCFLMMDEERCELWRCKDRELAGRTSK